MTEPLSPSPDTSDPLPPGTAAPSGAELERLRSGLRLMALRALGDVSAAEEVAQETVVRVLTAIRDRRDGQRVENLGGFAHGVAKRVIAGRFRERSRRTMVPLRGDLGQKSLPAPGPDPLSALVAIEDRQRIHRALEQLPSTDRQLLKRCFFEDLRPAAIAESLGEPPERIRKRKSRALARLRQVFFDGAADRTESGVGSVFDGEIPTGLVGP